MILSKAKTCFYNKKNHCSHTLTKEHVVSSAVIKSLELENSIILADVMNNEPIRNHEQTIKDVCSKCNNESLSEYDNAGKKLANYLCDNKSNTPLTIPFGKLEFGWLLKTHLNFFRVVKDKLSGKPFKVSQKIKNNIIEGKSFNNSFCLLLVRQIDESNCHWDEGAVKRLPSYYYNSKRVFIGDLIYSRFQMRQFDTVLFFPIDANYKNFDKRVDDFIEQWKCNPILQSFIDLEGYELIDIELLMATNKLPIRLVMTPSMLTKRIEKAFNHNSITKLNQKFKT